MVMIILLTLIKFINPRQIKSEVMEFERCVIISDIYKCDGILACLICSYKNLGRARGDPNHVTAMHVLRHLRITVSYNGLAWVSLFQIYCAYWRLYDKIKGSCGTSSEKAVPKIHFRISFFLHSFLIWFE